MGTPLELYLHGNVYDPSLWAGHLSEVKTRNGRLQIPQLGVFFRNPESSLVMGHVFVRALIVSVRSVRLVGSVCLDCSTC